MEPRTNKSQEHAVLKVWRQGHLSLATALVYVRWVRCFRRYCLENGLDDMRELCWDGAQRFLRGYAGSRLKGRASAASSANSARNALHAWAVALRILGMPVPVWRIRERMELPPLLDEYRQFRRAHQGVAEATLNRDIPTAVGFLGHLEERRRALARTTLVDVDAFVQTLAIRVSTGTVTDTCSSLRAFLHFLHITGRLHQDLAASVKAPRFRPSIRPPRFLAWRDVKRILRSVQQKKAPGRRDFAILLLLATYGLGAAEVLALHLSDLDWRAGVMRVRRPKTGVLIELPLLPAVAKALAAYLRWERPPAPGVTRVFLRKNMPYAPMTSGAIRHRIRYYAKLAGIPAKVIGAHIFRHSHASRQVDAGANIEVVSKILGHRSSASTSIYVRVALRRLRQVGLRVPR